MIAAKYHLNAPMTKQEFMDFHEALVNAAVEAPLNSFEKKILWRMCIIEVMAKCVAFKPCFMVLWSCRSGVSTTIQDLAMESSKYCMQLSSFVRQRGWVASSPISLSPNPPQNGGAKLPKWFQSWKRWVCPCYGAMHCVPTWSPIFSSKPIVLKNNPTSSLLGQNDGVVISSPRFGCRY